MQARGFSLVRLLAVVSTVALMAGYVWFRQAQSTPTGGGEPASPEPEPVLMPGSKSPGRALLPEDQQAVMPGSKSARVVFPDDFREVPGIPGDPGAGPEKPRTVLPGSKSLSPVFETPESRQADEE